MLWSSSPTTVRLRCCSTRRATSSAWEAPGERDLVAEVEQALGLHEVLVSTVRACELRLALGQVGQRRIRGAGRSGSLRGLAQARRVGLVVGHRHPFVLAPADEIGEGTQEAGRGGQWAIALEAELEEMLGQEPGRLPTRRGR